MREIRQSGSEGGGFEFNRFSLPPKLGRPFGAYQRRRPARNVEAGEKSGLETGASVRRSGPWSRVSNVIGRVEALRRPVGGIA
jgi:hypothetical protein